MPLAIGSSFTKASAGASSVKRMYRGTVSAWNADAADWVSRVYAAGATVSSSTANAVTAFCNAIDAAGIRSKFYRTNLFCGSSITAALIPLYRSSSYGGAVLGGASDTNNNFVSADYVETGASGGLLGNGTTKYLNTGLAPNAAPSTATGHLSAWTRGGSVSGTRRLLGAEETVVANRFTLDRRLAAGGGDGFQWGSLGSGNNTDDDTAGLISGSRVSATDSRFYKNGTQVGTTQAASATVTAHSNPWYVFASNQNGTAGTYYERRLAAYSIGGEMTASQMANYYTAMLAFQTALGRQV